MSELASELARTSDPSTSHTAADQIEQSGKVAHNCELTYQRIRENPGVTAPELDGMFPEIEPHKRVAQLVREGRIHKGEKRISKGKGGVAYTLWPVIQGKPEQLA